MIADKTPLDSQVLYEKLFVCSPDAILVVGSDGFILETNPQVERLFGYTSTELRGQPVEFLLPVRFRAVHLSHRQKYARHPHMRAMGVKLELHGLRKDLSEFPVDIMLSPLDSSSSSAVLCVIRDISVRKQQELELQRLASTDVLTHLGNYRRLSDSFSAETQRSQRTSRPVALLVMDVDGLKKINDTLGHMEGNHALCRVADSIRAECRAIDVAVRHGGDEFAILSPETNAEGAHSLGQRIAARLAADGQQPRLSLSFGLAVYPTDGNTLDQLITAADLPLYAMKKSPRSW
jgi:diguanylate cyclase (GGDEF)-like protein/PAS domain S-box-containing protein